MLLDTYVTEVKKQHEDRLYTKIKPKDYSTGEAILCSTGNASWPCVAGASLLVKECFRDSQRDFAIRGLLKALFRKELPYNDGAIRPAVPDHRGDMLAVSVLPIGMILYEFAKVCDFAWSAERDARGTGTTIEDAPSNSWTAPKTESMAKRSSRFLRRRAIQFQKPDSI